ncbi:MAG: LAGLIDADG family homing endonuclease [Gammaproteobacteria bacterium]|nr:LAGLIDADG family homing endonuclease [Gammaproteobacteria bacterium]
MIGQIGSKTDGLRRPGWIYRHPAPRHFLPFLAGLIDTDGTVSTERGSATHRARRTSTSLEAAERTAGLLRRPRQALHVARHGTTTWTAT